MTQNLGRIAYFEAKAKLLENNAKRFALEGRIEESMKAGFDMVRAMNEVIRLRASDTTEGGDAA
jgi:uncharacterized protein (UPF0335 family)